MTREELRARAIAQAALRGLEGIATLRFHDDGRVEVYAQALDDVEDGDDLLEPVEPLCRYATGYAGYAQEVENLRDLASVALVMKS